MRTIRLVLEYDGSAFSGWQIQIGVPTAPTIQGALEAALLEMTGETIRVRGASRTDAGVHARGQVVAFETDKDRIPMRGFTRGLTAMLPDQIVVRQAEEVEAGYDPRRTSRGKIYRYTYWNDTAGTALDRHRAWIVHAPLDLERMSAAGALLLGTHDFESFRAAGCTAKHAVRTLYQVKVERGEYKRVHLTVIGNAFLRNMVRIIAGNLCEVGTGKRSVEDISRILAVRDRTQAGITAPAEGLCLEEVVYDDRLPPRPRDGAHT